MGLETQSGHGIMPVSWQIGGGLEASGQPEIVRWANQLRSVTRSINHAAVGRSPTARVTRSVPIAHGVCFE